MTTDRPSDAEPLALKSNLVLGPNETLVERLRLKATEDTTPGAWFGCYLLDAASEIERLRDEKQKTLEAVRMLNAMFSRNCAAMQAAVADMVLRGDKQGWQWIINTLDGPGLLPDMDAVKAAGGAQAWFDAELAAEEARVAGLGA